MMTNDDMSTPGDHHGTSTDQRPMDPPVYRMNDIRTAYSRSSGVNIVTFGGDRSTTDSTREAFVQHDHDRPGSVRTETVRPRLDRVRWTSIWAGLVVALALYLFFQLALVATGTVDLAEATSSAAWWSAGAAVVSFLAGGIVAATVGPKLRPRRQSKATTTQS
jgi:hypothetical protein